MSASELVSGSTTIGNNGTYDVTNLASVTIDVSSGGNSVTQDENGYIILPITGSGGGGGGSSSVQTATGTFTGSGNTTA